MSLPRCSQRESAIDGCHGLPCSLLRVWLAETYAHQRTVRLVDGPDEVHRNAIAKIELAKRTAVRRGAAG